MHCMPETIEKYLHVHPHCEMPVSYSKQCNYQNEDSLNMFWTQKYTSQQNCTKFIPLKLFFIKLFVFYFNTL